AWLRELTRDTIDDFDTFRAQGLARLPAPDDAVAFAKEIRDPERHPFSTPSGKIEIYSMAIAAKPDPYGLGPISPIPTWVPDAHGCANVLTDDRASPAAAATFNTCYVEIARR